MIIFVLDRLYIYYRISYFYVFSAILPHLR